jgi:hypothetical protein
MLKRVSLAAWILNARRRGGNDRCLSEEESAEEVAQAEEDEDHDRDHGRDETHHREKF